MTVTNIIKTLSSGRNCIDHDESGVEGNDGGGDFGGHGKDLASKAL